MFLCFCNIIEYNLHKNCKDIIIHRFNLQRNSAFRTIKQENLKISLIFNVYPKKIGRSKKGAKFYKTTLNFITFKVVLKNGFIITWILHQVILVAGLNKYPPH